MRTALLDLSFGLVAFVGTMVADIYGLAHGHFPTGINSPLCFCNLLAGCSLIVLGVYKAGAIRDKRLNDRRWRAFRPPPGPEE